MQTDHVKLDNIKFYIGPMSKNVVDSVIEVSQEHNIFGLIPSRRQVEHNGGYVNNWRTDSFAKYIEGRVPICRDHGGPNQGIEQDEGFQSLSWDLKYFNIIHLDPWLKYKDYNEGLARTVSSLNYVHERNPDILFEVGTEEALRKFTVQELDRLLTDLSRELSEVAFSRIAYAVVQSGVGLDLGKQINTGSFNAERLSEMVKVCREHGVLSKEHNGDYLTKEEVSTRFELGLTSINIAPEFGQIETLCYLEEMGEDIESYYQICLSSGKWKKWVDSDFDPSANKKELIKICGHYVLSDPEFIKIKPNIDSKIKSVIKDHIKNMY